MSTVIGTLRRVGSKLQRILPAAAVSGCILALACVAWLTAAPRPAAAADPAVKFMAQVGRELMAAARTRSPGVMASVIERYGDVSYIGLYSLGSYRSQLSVADRVIYYGGMVRFISRYAATEAPKFPVARVEWADQRSGDTGVGTAVPGTDRSGFFWFFEPQNIELVVKILDARQVNGRFWVFYGALSDVAYTITVTDTETGEQATYHNPPGEICGRGDTAAF